MNSQPEKRFLSIYFPDFPAQVEACWDHDLWNQPYIITRQRTDNDRSVVIAVSDYARRYGVRPGMPVQKVRMRYRNIKVLKENAPLQERARKEILSICSRFTPDVEMDKYRNVTALDLTGSQQLYGGQYEHMDQIIIRQLREQIGFRKICMGMAHSLIVSTLCARSAMPNHLKKCTRQNEDEVLADINAELLPRLGNETRRRLRNLNLTTIGAIRSMSKDFLLSRFGPEGGALFGMVRGVNNPRKNISIRERIRADIIFSVNTNDHSILNTSVVYVSDQLTFRLREKRMKTKNLTLVITFSDNKSVQLTTKFSAPTWNFSVIKNTAMDLFESLYTRRVSLRKIEQISGRLYPDKRQPDLFETTEDHKHQRIGQALDAIRHTLGFRAIQNAETNGFLHGNQ